jgi:hypothetical protein
MTLVTLLMTLRHIYSKGVPYDRRLLLLIGL